MNWIELSVATDAEGAEAAAARLNEFVSGGAVIEETLLVEAGETIDPARAFTVRAFFSPDDRAGVARAEQALWHLAQLRSMSDPRTRELAEEDWAEAWKKHYTILHIGNALVVKPSWLDYTPQPHEVIVELDPGMAFGTGLHPTTRLCMVALEEFSASHPERSEAKSKDDPSQGYRMIDVGTGSGILSITAAKLGARDILALDLDPIAVETAVRNVAINQAERMVRVERGSIDAEKHRNLFDLVCINILAEVICELSPAVASALRPGGIVIASGILDFKADVVIDALREVGIETVEKKQEEDWVTLVGKKS
ncbi:MAG: 50S ribosomal protein L11 methyltransferase [Chloroflexota bacterium]|nr:50S ribosomal protein L11 methyltransferase [Chloroflexota bacterium]